MVAYGDIGMSGKYGKAVVIELPFSRFGPDEGDEHTKHLHQTI